MSQFLHHKEHSLLALGRQNCQMMWIERGVVYCEDLMEHESSVWAERRVLRVIQVVGLHITHTRL
jgi:hypothetical protein